MIDPILDQRIREAILGRRLLQFDYRGAARVAEPHDYGVIGGHVRLLAYQVRGQSRHPLPGWRTIDVAEIGNIVVLPETFRGSRARTNQAHKHWEEIYLRVE